MRRHRAIPVAVIPLALVALAAMAGLGWAQETPVPTPPEPGVALGEDDIYAASLRALTILLVVAILIENALALIFNWRVFRTYFSVSGLKTVISFVVSLLVVWNFELDILSALLTAYGEAGESEPSTATSQVLTALILAGGSAGVNTVMRALGYRGPSSDDAPPRPPRDKAWIAVRVRRREGAGALQISVTEDPRAPATLPAMAGTVMASRPGLGTLLLRNNNRFPQNGGYEVAPGTAYRVAVIGRDAEGERKIVPVSEEAVKLAPGAMIDFDVTF